MSLKLVCAFLVFQCLGHAAPVRFAMVGDYGVDESSEMAVANLIKTNLQPEFIVTCGDNQYGAASDIDRNVGKYYHAFIGNYQGTYGSGASSNRFFPALGNHDYLSPGGYAPHLAYFTLPGNERYYDLVRGPVHIFIVNSEANEPDGTTANSIQARWLSNRLVASSSPWKIVVVHDPPYSSSGSTTGTQWPFRAWGASAVISGDAHNYERIVRNDCLYLVNGAGGAGLAGFGSPVTGSLVRYNANHGALLVTADARQITFAFHSVANGGSVIDQITLFQPPALELVRTGGQQALVRWPTNGAGSFQLQASPTPALSNSWQSATPAPMLSNGNLAVPINMTGSTRVFRLRQP